MRGCYLGPLGARLVNKQAMQESTDRLIVIVHRRRTKLANESHDSFQDMNEHQFMELYPRFGKLLISIANLNEVLSVLGAPRAFRP